MVSATFKLSDVGEHQGLFKQRKHNTSQVATKSTSCSGGEMGVKWID